MSDWKQSEAKHLAIMLGRIPSSNISADGMRHLLRDAYELRAALNHKIDRVQSALAELDPAYAERLRENTE